MVKLRSLNNFVLCALLGVLTIQGSTNDEENEMNSIEQKMAELGLRLPQVSQPVANYLPYVITGNLVYISGQLPTQEGKVQVSGKVGEAVSIEQAQWAAQLCILNVLAQLKQAVGSFDRVKQCVKLTGFVNASPDFTAHSTVINGASDLLVAILGANGKHARAAVGVASLPLGASVEIEAIFELKD